MMRMGSNSLKQGRNHDGIIYEEKEEEIEADHVGIDSSPCPSEVSSSVESLESGLMEDDEATSSSSSSLAGDPLHDMSSLMQHLPLKRGLSNYFQGKSQSFTSLSNVRCLEDLVKPDNPNNKKLKSCQSYGGLSSDQSHQSHRSSAPSSSSSSSSNHFPRTITASSSSSSSRFISRKAMPRGSCSSLSAKRTASFLANRPPIPPHHPHPHPHPHPHGSTGTSSFSNQTPLFAWCHLGI